MATTAPIILPIETPGLAKLRKLEQQMEALEKDVAGVTRKLPQATNQIKKFGNQAKNTESKVSGLAKSVRGLVTAAALLGTAKFIIGKTAQLETQTRSLQVLTGELETAKQIVSELQSFAAVTPFTSSELIESAKRLKAFGVDTEKLVATTQRLADVSGATGARLNEVATAYGQIQAKGRLQGEELLQLQERGIALQDELQKMYGLTGEEFSEALRKGQFSAEAVEVAIVRLTEKGGKYADGAISQSDTLAGKFSTLVDGIENIARKLGTVLAPALKSVLDLAIDAVNNINAAFAAASITDQQKQGFKALAESEVQSFAGPLPGGPFGAGEVVVRTNGKTYRGSASGVVSQITNDLINKEVQRLTKDAAPKIAKSNVEIKTPDLNTGGNDDGSGSGSGNKAAEDAAKLLNQQLKAGQDLAQQFERNIALRSAASDLERDLLQNAFDLEDALARINETAADSQKDALRALAIEDSLAEATKIRGDAADEIQRKIQGAIEPLERQQQFLQDTLTFGREEAELRQKIRDIMKDLPEDQRAVVEGLVRGNAELTKQAEMAQDLENLYAQIGQTVANGLVDGITGLIDGTKTLEESLSGILKQIGEILIQFAVMQAFKGLGFPGFADGGRPTVGQYAIVGEEGPELVKFDQPSTVYSNEQSKSMVEAMGRYSPANGNTGGGSAESTAAGNTSAEAIPSTFRLETTVINGVEYATVAQVQQMGASAQKAGAKEGEARALRKLQMSPAARRKAGF